MQRQVSFDAADLAYVKDEGTILRKLFAAFSLRPTIVQTVPYYGITQNYLQYLITQLLQSKSPLYL